MRAGIAQSVQRLVTGCTAEGSEFRSTLVQDFFLPSTSSRPALGPTQPHTQWVLGALSPVVKQPGRESILSPIRLDGVRS
jgi:hypothetical protein